MPHKVICNNGEMSDIELKFQHTCLVKKISKQKKKGVKEKFVFSFLFCYKNIEGVCDILRVSLWLLKNVNKLK